MRRTPLLVLAFALMASPALATPIHYTFSGEGGLAGGFILDDEALVITVGGDPFPGVSGIVSSPLNSLWGTFGAYEFAGTPTLSVFDDRRINPFFDADHWIVRTPITFSSGGVPAIVT